MSVEKNNKIEGEYKDQTQQIDEVDSLLKSLESEYVKYENDFIALNKVMPRTDINIDFGAEELTRSLKMIALFPEDVLTDPQKEKLFDIIVYDTEKSRNNIFKKYLEEAGFFELAAQVKERFHFIDFEKRRLKKSHEEELKRLYEQREKLNKRIDFIEKS